MSRNTKGQFAKGHKSYFTLQCKMCNRSFSSNGHRKCCSLKCLLLSRRNIADHGCWEWTGVLTKGGYGKIGRPTQLAHRVAYKEFKGDIPENLHVCHRCDNRKCFNPDHLFVGTQSDNIKDCKKKGRLANQKKGEQNSHAKLNNSLVIKIRQDLEDGAKGIDIAIEYGISEALVSGIKNKRKWLI